jgi:hypothetical protein
MQIIIRCPRHRRPCLAGIIPSWLAGRRAIPIFILMLELEVTVLIMHAYRVLSNARRPHAKQGAARDFKRVKHAYRSHVGCKLY